MVPVVQHHLLVLACVDGQETAVGVELVQLLLGDVVGLLQGQLLVLEDPQLGPRIRDHAGSDVLAPEVQAYQGLVLQERVPGHSLQAAIRF